MGLETVELIITLLGVLGLIYLLWYLARRFSFTAGNSGRLSRGLSVVERLPLTQDKSLAVVRAGNRMLLLGLSAQRVELITELEPEEWQMFSGMSNSAVAGTKAVAKSKGHGPSDTESSDSAPESGLDTSLGDTENDPAENVSGVSMKQRDAVWNVSAGAIRGGSFQDGYSCLLDKNPSGWKKFLYCLKLALVQHPMLKPFIPKKVREGVEAQLPYYQKASRGQGSGDFERLLEDEQAKRKSEKDSEKK